MATCQLDLTGVLNRAQLDAALAGVEGKFNDGCCLLVNCLQMDDYETAARDRFVEWNKEHRSMLARVAIVTDKPLWRVVASTMALVTQQEMKVFSAIAEAEAWLAEV